MLAEKNINILSLIFLKRFWFINAVYLLWTKIMLFDKQGTSFVDNVLYIKLIPWESISGILNITSVWCNSDLCLSIRQLSFIIKKYKIQWQNIKLDLHFTNYCHSIVEPWLTYRHPGRGLLIKNFWNHTRSHFKVTIFAVKENFVKRPAHICRIIR